MQYLPPNVVEWYEVPENGDTQKCRSILKLYLTCLSFYLITYLYLFSCIAFFVVIIIRHVFCFWASPDILFSTVFNKVC